jgi:hypothetical protein
MRRKTTGNQYSKSFIWHFKAHVGQVPNPVQDFENDFVAQCAGGSVISTTQGFTHTTGRSVPWWTGFECVQVQHLSDAADLRWESECWCGTPYIVGRRIDRRTGGYSVPIRRCIRKDLAAYSHGGVRVRIPKPVLILDSCWPLPPSRAPSSRCIL